MPLEGISTNEQEDDFSCDQAEADTIMFSIYAALRHSGFRRLVVVDSADTDVYSLDSYISKIYPGDLQMKRKDEVVDCTKFAEDSMADLHHNNAPHHQMWW